MPNRAHTQAFLRLHFLEEKRNGLVIAISIKPIQQNQILEKCIGLINLRQCTPSG